MAGEHGKQLPLAIRAVHEAAHAVVAHALGIKVILLSLSPKGGVLAQMRTERDLVQEMRASDDRREKLMAGICNLTIAAAGPLAQKRYAEEFHPAESQWTDLGCESDWKQVDLTKDRVEPQDQEKLLRFYQRCVQDVVSERWSTICSLANRLETQVCLNEAEIDSALGPPNSTPSWPEIEEYLIASGYAGTGEP